MIVIRPAKREDVEAFFGRPPPFTITHTQVADKDGEILALMGVYWYESRRCIFSELKEEALIYRKKILATAKAFVRKLPKGVYYAVADDERETADRFLRHLGFEYDAGLYRIEVS